MEDFWRNIVEGGLAQQFKSGQNTNCGCVARLFNAYGQELIP